MSSNDRWIVHFGVNKVTEKRSEIKSSFPAVPGNVKGLSKKKPEMTFRPQNDQIKFDGMYNSLQGGVMSRNPSGIRDELTDYNFVLVAQLVSGE